MKPTRALLYIFVMAIIVLQVINLGCRMKEKIYFISYRISTAEWEQYGNIFHMGDLIPYDSIKKNILKDYNCMGTIIVESTDDIIITGIYRFEDKEEYELFKGDRSTFKMCNEHSQKQ